MAQVKTLCCIPTATESISIFSNVLNSLRQRANDFAHEMLPLCILQLFNHLSFITNCNTGILRSKPISRTASFCPKSLFTWKIRFLWAVFEFYTLQVIIAQQKRYWRNILTFFSWVVFNMTAGGSNSLWNPFLNGNNLAISFSLSHGKRLNAQVATLETVMIFGQPKSPLNELENIRDETVRTIHGSYWGSPTKHLTPLTIKRYW